MSKNPLTALLANAVAALALSTSTFWPSSDDVIVATSASADTPSVARARMASNFPGSPNSDCAFSVVKNTALDPSDASDEPNVASPTMVNASVGFCVAILMRSPSLNFADFITPRSTTTSPADCGARPLKSL